MILLSRGTRIVWTQLDVSDHIYYKNIATGISGRIDEIDTLIPNSSAMPSSVDKHIEQPTHVSASNIIEMQKTSTPLYGIFLALLMILGGFIGTRKK